MDTSLILQALADQLVLESLGHTTDPKSLGRPAGAGGPWTRRCSSEPWRTSRGRRTLDTSSAEALGTSPVRKNPLVTSAERNLGARALADQSVLESLGHVAVPGALANQQVLEDLGQYIIQTHFETVNQCGMGWADTEGAGERKVRSWSWRPSNSTWLLPRLGGGVEPAGVGEAGPQDPGAGATTRRKDVVGGEVRVTRSTLDSSPASPRRGDGGAKEWWLWRGFFILEDPEWECLNLRTHPYRTGQQVWFGRLTQDRTPCGSRLICFGGRTQKSN